MTRRFLTPLSTNHVDFNLDNPSTWAEGRLWWDDEEGTLELGHGDGVTQSIGMEFFMPPTKNNSGVEIPAGSFVMATGAQGDRITIAKAVTDGSVNPEYMIGVAATTIDNGSETGLITTNGTVRDIDTSLWPVGTVLYPNSASAGALSASAGVAPDIRTPVAIVLRQHENTGRIYVRMTNAHKLGEKQDVKIDNPQNGDTLIYNGANSLWENKQAEAGNVEIGYSYPLSNISNGKLFYNISAGRMAIYYDSIWKELAYFDEIASIDGGSSSTTEFSGTIDGGDSFTTIFVNNYDGGTLGGDSIPDSNPQGGGSSTEIFPVVFVGGDSSTTTFDETIDGGNS